MIKKLLMTLGIFNVLFALFHILMGVHLQRMIGVSEEIRGLLQMLNVAATGFMLMIALAFLAYSTEVMNTRLGRLCLIFSGVLYGLRAAEEFFWASRVSVLIVTVCLLTALPTCWLGWRHARR